MQFAGTGSSARDIGAAAAVAWAYETFDEDDE